MRRLLFIFALIGLLYTASCVHSCYRTIEKFETPHRRASLPPLVLDDTDTTTLPPPTGRTDFDFVPPHKEAEAFDFGAGSRVGDGFEAYLDDSHTASIDPTVELLCAPGLVVLNALGIGTPESTPLWICVVLFSWLVYGMTIRLAFVLSARYFGIGYSPRAYRYWLWLVPPWRPIYRALRPVILWLRLLRFNRGDSDQWAGFLERAACTFKPGNILLGRQSLWFLPGLQPCGLQVERGAVTAIASPGAGKSSWLTTHLSMYPGNFVCVDCDGSIINAIGKRLESEGKRVIKLDPFNLAPEFPNASWNAIEEIDDGVRRYGIDAAIDFSAALAEGMIKATLGQNNWIGNDSRAFEKSHIPYIYRYAEPGQRNMVYLRQTLTQGEKARPQDDRLLAMLAGMKIRSDWNGAIAAGAEMLKRSFSRSDGRSIPLSYCIEQTQWLDIPGVARMSKRSTFHCLDLKAEQGVCVFLVLPLQAIQGWLSGWVRTFVAMTMYAFQRDTRHRPKQPTLFVLDEAAHLQLDMKTALGGYRKYGISVLSIFQSVSQMRDAYPDAWHDYLGLSECNIWMTSGDQGTLEYLSNTLGTATRTERVRGNWPLAGEPRNQKENRRLMSPGQLKLFLKDNIIVTRADAPPMALKSLRHYLDLPVRWLTPSSFYGETRARAFTRRLLHLFTGRKAFQPNRPTISIEA